jgi:cytidylate kinase
MIIAIDGPAASGKGTLAQRLALRYGLPHLDTGMLYRAVARDVLASRGSLDDAVGAEAAARALDYTTLTDQGLRGRDMSDAASVVAAIPAVRAALLDMQKEFARRPRGAVVEGRDIGTVVCPEADIKLFITADLHERARRRYHELIRRGEQVSEEDVLHHLRKRDERDSSRTASPLRMAPDAHLLDTTKLDIEAAFFAAVRLIDAAIGRSVRS